MLEKDILQNSEYIQDGVFFKFFFQVFFNFRVFKQLLQNLNYYVNYIAIL
jgi:hypothetical protein